MIMQAGDCFESAIRTLPTLLVVDRDAVVVHGIVTGQQQTAGIKHVHAWCEFRVGDLVLVRDCCNGGSLTMFAAQYYQIGEIDKVRRYGLDDVQRLLLETEHCGFWDPMFDAVQDAAIKECKRRGIELQNA